MYGRGTNLVLPSIFSPGEHVVGATDVLSMSQGARYLGIWFSPCLSPEVSLEQLRGAVHDFAWRLDAPRLVGRGVRYMTDAVLWARLGSRLRFERMAEGDVRLLEWAEWQLWRMWLRASQLGITANLHIVGGDSRPGGLGWTRAVV